MDLCLSFFFPWELWSAGTERVTRNQIAGEHTLCSLIYLMFAWNSKSRNGFVYLERTSCGWIMCIVCLEPHVNGHGLMDAACMTHWSILWRLGGLLLSWPLDSNSCLCVCLFPCCIALFYITFVPNLTSLSNTLSVPNYKSKFDYSSYLKNREKYPIFCYGILY